jgi:hypothetical protein
VGQWSDRREAETALEAMRSTWQPLTFTVDRVFVITRATFQAPFAVRWSVPLGLDGGRNPHPTLSSPSRLDVSYVATVGGHPALPPPPPPPLGLGESDALAAVAGGGGGGGGGGQPSFVGRRIDRCRMHAHGVWWKRAQGNVV